MNNIDGYHHQVVSHDALTKLVVSFHGSGWSLVPMSLFPGLVAGRPTIHWGHHGVKVTDLETALSSITGGDAITLNWDGYSTFIIVSNDGYHANLTVYPRHQKGKKD